MKNFFSSKEEFFAKLKCPECGGALSVPGVSCGACRINFLSGDGLPELLPQPLRYGGEIPDEYSAQKIQREHFDQWARADSSYEEFAANPTMLGHQLIALPYVTGGIQKDEWVLDIGCGHGMFSVAAARAGARVIAFDISRELVLRAIKRAEDAQVSERMLFFVGDGGNMPAADNSFDRVMTMGSLHHMPDARKTCADIARVLRPGGRYFFNENNRSVLRPVFDLMMKIYPLWNEEAGDMPLISERELRQFLAPCSLEAHYSVYMPPHLINMTGKRAGKFLVAATDKIFNKIPAVRRLGGVIYGHAQKPN